MYITTPQVSTHLRRVRHGNAYNSDLLLTCYCNRSIFAYIETPFTRTRASSQSRSWVLLMQSPRTVYIGLVDSVRIFKALLLEPEPSIPMLSLRYLDVNGGLRSTARRWLIQIHDPHSPLQVPRSYLHVRLSPGGVNFHSPSLTSETVPRAAR